MELQLQIVTWLSPTFVFFLLNFLHFVFGHFRCLFTGHISFLRRVFGNGSCYGRWNLLLIRFTYRKRVFNPFIFNLFISRGFVVHWCALGWDDMTSNGCNMNELWFITIQMVIFIEKLYHSAFFYTGKHIFAFHSKYKLVSQKVQNHPR